MNWPARASAGCARSGSRRSTADPDAPPFFGRTDRDDTTPTAGRGAEVAAHRPPARPRPGPEPGRHRLAGADLAGLLPGHAGRPDGRHVCAAGSASAAARPGGSPPTRTSTWTWASDLGLDSQILRAEIERPRVGPMRDIVSTIQPDQDELVRADLDTSLCIQGSPGTGKTAVGLHRAAYLLYTYPERLRRTGVLVVGPNAAFLHYIAQVLPALGEGGIAQATVDELVSGETGVRHGGRTTRRCRGAQGRRPDGRRPAPRRPLPHRPPVDDVVAVSAPVATGSARTTCAATSTTRAASWPRASCAGTRAANGSGCRWPRTSAASARPSAAHLPTPRRASWPTRAPVRGAVDAVWPPLTAPACSTGSTPTPAFLARCAPDLSSRASGRCWRWPADRVQRDGRSGPPPTACCSTSSPALLDGTAIYVHVVVDEAQDLSADAVPRGRPPQPARLADRARRPGPGDHAVGARVVAGDAGPPRPARRAGPPADHRLPRARRGARGRQPPARAHRAGAARRPPRSAPASIAIGFAARAELAAAVRRCAGFDGSIGVDRRRRDGRGGPGRAARRAGWTRPPSPTTLDADR